MLDANNLRESTNFLPISSGHTSGGTQSKGGKAAGGYVGILNAHQFRGVLTRLVQKFFHLHIVGVGIYHCPHHFRGKCRTTPKRLRPPGVNERSDTETSVNFTAKIVSHYVSLNTLVVQSLPSMKSGFLNLQVAQVRKPVPLAAVEANHLANYTCSSDSAGVNPMASRRRFASA